MEDNKNIPGEAKPAAQKTDTANSIIQNANDAAARIEAANKEAADLYNKNAELAAIIRLGGRAEAGQVSKSAEQVEQEKIDARVAATLSKYGISPPK